MKQNRGKHNPSFKARVALEALKSEYTSQGFKGQVFHVHVRYSGDWDELYLRDYLLAHPEIADEYGQLKLELMKKYEHDRDGYTYAKTDFIKRITKLARADIQIRY